MNNWTNQTFRSFIQTLERHFLLRRDGQIIERPQYFFMRVACSLHAPRIHLIQEEYDKISRHFFRYMLPLGTIP